MKRFDGLKIINAYGPTEATCAVCGIESTGEMCESAVLPVGKTDLATCNISVCDGEIVLDGKSVFGGYLGKEPLELLCARLCHAASLHRRLCIKNGSI